MRSPKPLLLYCGMILLFGGLIWYLLYNGQSLAVGTKVPAMAHQPATGDKSRNFFFHLNEALPRLLLQIAVIILVTQLLGALFRKIGQPTVVGEVVAGIILGPSLLGLIAPSAFHFLFPGESMEALKFLSQIGLVLFMFIIGMELDTRLIRQQAVEALFISHASILIPYALGIILSIFTYQKFSGEQASFLSFALFMGIAMSITAFPVLARIIRDRRLTNTRLGNLAITCAASDDVTAWCVLALLVAFVQSGSGLNGFATIVLVLIYAAVMLAPVRLFLNYLVNRFQQKRMSYGTLMSIIFTIVVLSAYCTEVIGIHALFGAFLAGAIMPNNEALRHQITGRISDLTLVLLLPLFFVFTGLRTYAGLLGNDDWMVFVFVLLVAVLGKFGGSAIAARLMGQTWTDSLSVGALMNTRGLVELIVLNIGYDMGVLNTEIFSMLVMMAVLTTMMTSPALHLINKISARKLTRA